MIDKERIVQIAEEVLGDNSSELFVVEVKVSTANDIEIVVDSDTRVSIDECAKLSKSIETQLEEQGVEDFSLTVCSSGIGYPLKTIRQMKKCVGKTVQIILHTGSRVERELVEVSDSEITVSFSEKIAVEGKKRKEVVVRTEIIPNSEIKTITELLTIK